MDEGFGEVSVVKKLEPLQINLSAQGLCPRIKLSRTLLNFGECPVNDHRDIAIQIRNVNEDLPLDFRFKRVIFFKPLITDLKIA